jgi:hypothetical protein
MCLFAKPATHAKLIRPESHQEQYVLINIELSRIHSFEAIGEHPAYKRLARYGEMLLLGLSFTCIECREPRFLTAIAVVSGRRTRTC